MTEHRAHCRCEGVVILASKDPLYSVFCHCDDCRRSAGAPLIAAVGFEKNYYRWESRETLSSWINGSCTRYFCSNCGSPISQEHESAPDITYFYTSFMDNPNLFPPTHHSFAPEKLSWLHLDDNLPKHERTVTIKL